MGLAGAVFALLAGVLVFVVWFVGYLGEPNPTQAQLSSPSLPPYPQAPRPEMGMVYVVRPSRMAMAVKYSIRLDDPTPAGQVATLRARRYVAVSVPPGAHDLFASTLEKNDRVTFEISAGETVAFIARPGFGAVLQTARLVPMDERAARFHVSRLPNTQR